MVEPISSGLTLPYRFREESFRYYEVIILGIVKAFPSVTVVLAGVTGLTTTTLSCRLRDAIESLGRYRWATNIDMDRFDEIRHLIVVGEREDCVVAGSREAVRAWRKDPPIIQSNEPFSVTPSNRNEIGLIALLAHNKVFNQPIRLREVADPESIVGWLSNSFDVLVTVDGPNSLILI